MNGTRYDIDNVMNVSEEAFVFSSGQIKVLIIDHSNELYFVYKKMKIEEHCLVGAYEIIETSEWGFVSSKEPRRL